MELKEIFLSGMFDFEQIFVRFSFKVQTLLDIFYCSDDSREIRLTGPAMQRMATTFPNISTLSLDYLTNTVGDGDIAVLEQTCKSLTDINLPHLSYITNAALCSIAQHLPGLTSLQIERCVEVSNVGVIALAKATSELLSLDLRHLQITIIAVQTIGAHCRKLRNLNVSYCALLTDDAFTTYYMSPKRALRERLQHIY